MSQEFFNKLLSAMEHRAIQEGKYIEYLQFIEDIRRRKKNEGIYQKNGVEAETE